MSTMSAAICRSEHQRAFGAVRVEMQVRNGKTVLAELRQEGCLKVRFPRPAGWTEAIAVNISGGVAGGDRLHSDIVVRAGAAACFTTPAAERFYRALPGEIPAELRNSIRVEPGAAAEWLPQESIVFDAAAFDRRLEIDIAEDGWFVGVETLVFGRAAMGETVREVRLRDLIRVRRAGALVLHDAIRIDGDAAATLARPAVACGGRAVATIVHIAPDAGERLAPLRAALESVPAEAGASAWNGMLIGRIVAADAAALRTAIVAGLQALRANRPLPRVWMC